MSSPLSGRSTDTDKSEDDADADDEADDLVAVSSKSTVEKSVLTEKELTEELTEVRVLDPPMRAP